MYIHPFVYMLFPKIICDASTSHWFWSEKSFPYPTWPERPGNGSNNSGPQVLCLVLMVLGITIQKIFSWPFGSGENGAPRGKAGTPIINCRSWDGSPETLTVGPGPLQDTKVPVTMESHLFYKPQSFEEPWGVDSTQAWIQRVHCKSWRYLIPPEGGICTFLFNELWRTKGHC